MPTPSLLLIHGPATGAWIWEHWRRELAALGWQVNVLDLRGHGRSMPTDLATVTLEDYVADVASVTVQIEAAQGVHPVLGGWSTGGLVAMMYAAQHKQTPALLLFDPALPVEVAGRAPMDTVRRFSGELLTPETFGVFPKDREKSRGALPELTDDELDGLLQRIEGEKESGIAYRQMLRGVSVDAGAIECPALILHSPTQSELASSLATYLGGETVGVPTAGVPTGGSWGIVCHGQAIAEASASVAAWLRQNLVSEGQ